MQTAYHAERGIGAYKVDGFKFSQFRDAVDRHMFHWNIRPTGDPLQFKGSIHSVNIHECVWADVEADGGLATRGDEQFRQDTHSYIALLIPIAGRTRFSQGPHEHVISPGQIGIYSTDRSCVLHSTTPTRQVSLSIASARARSALPMMDDWCGRVIDASTGLAWLLSEHIRALPRAAGGASAQDQAALQQLTIEFLTSLILSRSALDRNSTKQSLRAYAETCISKNITNPDLTPTSVAAAIGVSPRYLHLLYQDQEFTVGRLIRMSRLQASRSELRVMDRTRKSITQIAMQFCFADASHFCRAFKAEYGLTPIEFHRAEAQSEI